MKRNTDLFDLLWEDLIIAKILPHLSIKDCLNFRCASRTCQQIANAYLEQMKTLELLDERFTKRTFGVFTQHCRHLRIINLTKNLSITDDLLRSLLRNNSGLSVLILSHCKNLSAKCLQPVIRHSKSLTVLKLAECHWMTTGALEALALHQGKLENVDFSYCSSLSENGIQIFIKKFRKLSVLNLEGNTQVTDSTLHSLATYSKNLKLLNITRCSEVTYRGVKTVFLCCTSLKGILTKGCPKVEQSLKVLPYIRRTVGPLVGPTRSRPYQ